MQVHYLVMSECHFSWQAQHLVMLSVTFRGRRNICNVGVSLFVAGAVFGDLGVSLFVAGAVFGEIWVDSRSAKRCNFPCKMRLGSAKLK